MSEPIWSILLPTHNRKETLLLAIGSVLMQQEQSFELFIVADGCADGTAEEVNKIHDTRIKLLNLPKAPHFGYANRNIALKMCKGDFIAFMAHDDLWLPDHLSMLGEVLKEPDIDLVYSRPTWVTPEGMVFPLPFNLDDEECLSTFLEFKVNFIPASNVVHKRECFSRVGYWNETLNRYGDWDMWARIIRSKPHRNFRYVPETTNLHFRAIWKTEESEGPKVMKDWRKLFSKLKNIPAKANCLIPQGVLEQKVFLSNIKSGDQQYVCALRHAISSLIELKAAQDTIEISKLRSESKENSEQKIINQHLNTENLSLLNKINNIEGSLAYLIILRARMALERLAPIGTKRRELIRKFISVGLKPKHFPH